MKLILSLIIVITGTTLSAQINISIKFETDKIDQVEVWLYDDFISRSKKMAFAVDREVDGLQESIVDLTNTGRIIIKTGVQEESFYVQPGYDYDFSIFSKDIILQSNDKSNEFIEGVNALYSETRRKNIKWPMGDAKDSYVPEMKRLISELRALSPPNKYAKDLLKYTIANIEFDILYETHDIQAADQIEEMYISNTSIDYWNPKHIAFLQNYYDNRSNSLHIRRTPFRQEAPYESFFEELNFAQNDTIQQIAAVNFIEYAAKAYWGGSIEYTNRLLDSLKNNAVNEALKASIDLTYNRVNSLNVGDQVEQFAYFNRENEIVKLSQFGGKWVLLDFWFVGCVGCHEALPELKALQAKYEGCLEIVGINPRDSLSRVINYSKKNDITWNLFSSKYDSNIMSYFGIWVYPTYFLIDPEGKFTLIPKNLKFEKIKDQINNVLKSGCN